MSSILTGKKTYIVMGASLVVALFQHFYADIPAVDPELWNIVLPVVGLVLRYVTKTPAVGSK